MSSIRAGNGNREMFKGAFALTLSVIIVKIIGFIYKVPLSYILTDEGMGYYNCAYTVFTFFFMLCTGGIPKAVSIIVTEFDIRGNRKTSEKTLSTLLLSFTVIGLTLSFFTFFFADIIAGIIGATMAASAIKTISPAIFFISVSGVLRGFLNGRKKLVTIAVSEVMDGALKFTFGLALALFAKRAGLDYTYIAALSILGVSIASFISSLFLFVSAKIANTNDKAGQNEEFFSMKDVFIRIIKIAFPITLSSAVLSISGIVDLGLVINRLKVIGFSESDAVALFGNFTTLAVPLLNLISALTSPLCAAALPQLCACSALGERAAFYNSAVSTLKLTAFIAVPSAIAFFTFPLEILSLLFNDESAIVAAPMLAVLSSSVLFLPLLTVLNTFLEASQKTSLPFISTCIGLVLKAVLSYVLISEPTVGILGAPIGTSVCYGASLVVSLLFVKSKIGSEIPFFQSLLKPAISGIISIGLGKILYSRISSGIYSAPFFVLCALICVILYVFFIFILERKEIVKACVLIKMTKNREIRL